MKLILAHPSIKRLHWELAVLLTNIKQFGEFEVVLLFSAPHDYDNTVPRFLADKYGVQCFVYGDTRDDKSYIPSIRPWLLWQYLAEDPAREQETYLYIDSDIIFREWIDFATLDLQPNKVVGSDCSDYIDYDYIVGCKNGETIAARMAEICGIMPEQMKGVPGIGAHIVAQNFSADFWKRCYYDSNKLHHYFATVDSDLQKWTAEMWAQLWGWVREGCDIVASSELDFCRPTDNLEEWDKVKILHNAGVTGRGDMFFKGMYVNQSPIGQDFTHIRRDKATLRYVEAIEKVLQ